MPEVAGGQEELRDGPSEATITRWLVKVGDWVKQNQDVADISTPAVDFGFPSPRAGRVAKLLFEVGDAIPAGARRILLFEGEDESAPPT